MAVQVIGEFPVNNTLVYAIGGADASFNMTASMDRYDATLDAWTTLAPLPSARMQISAAQIDGKIYVPGGYATSFSPSNQLMIYDVSTDNWGLGAPLPQATGDYALGTWQDRYVYVIGGYTGSSDTNLVQVYDTETNIWTNATPKPGTATAGLRAGIVGNHIVVVGGYSQTLSSPVTETHIGLIDEANPTLISWEPGPAYPGGTVGRLGGGIPLAATVASGSPQLGFVVFTGGDPNGGGTAAINHTWIYDVHAEAWKSAPAKSIGVSNIGNIVGVPYSGKLHIVATGGFNGTDVAAASQWLALGDEVASDLALDISGNPGEIHPGGVITLSFDYVANGPGPAPDVLITTSVPQGTQFDSGNSDAGWICTPNEEAGSDCELSLGQLDANDSGAAAFSLNVLGPPPAGLASFDVSATILSLAAFSVEADLSNNTASVSVVYPSVFSDGFEAD